MVKRKRWRSRNPKVGKKRVIANFTFSGPASRSDSDDAEEWREVKHEREEDRIEVENKYNVKAKVSRDRLIVKWDTDESFDEIHQKVNAIQAEIDSADDPEVTIK